MEPGNLETKKSVLTVKNVLRVLALLCIVGVFCPSFLVSCSGQTINVSAMTAVSGISTSYGSTIVEPHLIMLVCLLLPVAALVLLFLKQMEEKMSAGIILVCSVIDFIIWIIFKSEVKKIAEENYCTVKTTPWYYINMVIFVLIILLTVLVVASILHLDSDLITSFTGNEKQRVLDQMSATVSQMTNTVSQIADNVASNVSGNAGGRPQRAKEDTIGFCAKCGSPIPYGCKFCVSCGTPVPESMIAEAEAARKAAEEAEAARRAAEEAEAARRAAEAAEAARRAAEEAEARRAAQEAEAARQAEIARRQAEESAGENTEWVQQEDVQPQVQTAQAPQSAPETQQPAWTAGARPTFCQQCGSKLEPGARFCMSCGAKVE
jgi:hypothetical protein